ncbi:MAG: aminomethyltransferase family protein [Deltaproteobacteria bacterium]|nr:aminomethyltransferase family protein [Deltaproteobacteria bacterium]
MPTPTPFHPRTSELCHSLLWKEWAGYHAVRSYDTCHELEYFSIRHAAGAIDVSPLFKYDLKGPDVAAYLSRLTVKDFSKLKVGRVTYLCWCDDDGKVVDDGTVTRLDEIHYRLTAAEPSLHWLHRHARGYDVSIEDTSEDFGALAVQGPKARAILADCIDGDVEGLRFFGAMQGKLGDIEVVVTRTGYTGDLGYEVWIPSDRAVDGWDRIFEAGRPHRLMAAGLDAMDVTRVEAGFIMNGVDYYSAHHCFLESRKSTPYELGLGWTVKLEREPFIGQQALKAEKERGSEWATVGLVYDWDHYERLWDEVGLPPQVESGAWRTPVPVYDDLGQQVGYCTSGAWSPLLKQNLAIATVRADAGKLGSKLDIEVTVEFERRKCGATVTKMPFFDPARKRD